MQYRSLVSSLVLGLFVASCGGDDDEPSPSLNLQGSCLWIEDGVVEDCTNYYGSTYTEAVISNDCEDSVVMGEACPTATALRKCTINFSSTAKVEHFKYDPEMPDAVFASACSNGTVSSP